MDQADQMLKRRDIVQLVEFLRNAISECPSEWQLQYRLANALIAMGYQKYGPHAITPERCDSIRSDTEKNAQNECWKEAVSLYEEVLKKEIDDTHRTSVILALLSRYSEMGDFENAERIALSQSPAKISREVLLAKAAEDEKGDEYRGEAILTLMHELSMVIVSSLMIKHSLGYSQAGLDTLLAVARLYESIIDDGNYGILHNDMCMLYLRCSSVANHLNDSECALDYLETALEHFIEFKQAQEMPQFTASLVNKAKNCVTTIYVLDRESFEQYMQALPVDCVDAIRNNPKYASIFAQ